MPVMRKNTEGAAGCLVPAVGAVLYYCVMNAQNIAIVGATGAVGVEILRVLERRNFPVASLKLLASARSVGKTLEFKGKPYPVEELTAAAFKGIDIAFFSAGATRSREFVPAAKAAGAVVVDNSSAFRMDPETPLVVPEVNAGDLAHHKGVIANPNCTAAILATAVWPIHQAAGIKRIVVSTYQSASGAGAAAMQELEDQVRQYGEGKELTRSVFPHQIAFNVFSHNTKVAENGYNEEENKVVEEMRKMFHMPDLPIVPTCIRVPVLRAHSEAITLELEKPLSPAEARACSIWAAWFQASASMQAAMQSRTRARRSFGSMASSSQHLSGSALVWSRYQRTRASPTLVSVSKCGNRSRSSRTSAMRWKSQAEP